MGLIRLVNLIIALLIGVVFHEYMHGKSAELLGDPTPRANGRLTLNPIPHLDVTGSIILPIVILVASGFRFTFGMAKPMPVNPSYFKDKKQGMLITGISGPLANYFLAFMAALPLRFGLIGGGLGGSLLASLFLEIIAINIVLGTFNLIPIPPLDGSRVAQAFIPDRYRYQYNQLEKYGTLIIFIVAFIFHRVLWAIIGPVINIIFSLVLPISSGGLI